MSDKPELDETMQMIRATRGLSVRIANACGIDKAAVYQWTKVPPQWVRTVSKIIKQPPSKIRPDIFGR